MIFLAFLLIATPVNAIVTVVPDGVEYTSRRTNERCPPGIAKCVDVLILFKRRDRGVAVTPGQYWITLF